MMDNSAKLYEILKKNNGFLKTSDVAAAGISRAYLGGFVKANSLERVAHGIYMSEDAWPDNLFVLQQRFPSAVFSHETALYLLDMAERSPLKYSVTIKTGASATSLINSGAKVYKIKDSLYPLGITELKTDTGNKVVAYGAERTICDLIRSRSSVEIQEFQAAIRGYVRMKGKELSLLAQYAKLFHVEKTLRNYLDVLMP